MMPTLLIHQSFGLSRVRNLNKPCSLSGLHIDSAHFRGDNLPNPIPVKKLEESAFMSKQINRRKFIHYSALVSSGTALAASFEEKALLAQTVETNKDLAKVANSIPRGKIGKLEISRLICGGNLISGFAHSRDLIYVSALLKKYFTDDKVCETLALCEAQGINTAILRVDQDTLRILKKYRQEHGGKIQWIAQARMTESNIAEDIQPAIDHGAQAIYVHGGVGDDLVKKGRVDLLGKALDFIKKHGIVAGIAGHSIEVPKACEKAGLNPDFYMKTFNSKRYWSAGPAERHDSVWEETPQETMAFMENVEKPWIAYKVLGAGAIHPQEGFAYAYANGADFICAGMFDFQIAEDVQLACKAILKSKDRVRPWMG